MGWPLKGNDVGQDIGNESLASQACLSLKVSYTILIEEYVGAATVDTDLPTVIVRV